MKKKNYRKPAPLWRVMLTDLVLTGAALLVFAYFHHVKPSEMEPVGLVSTRPRAETAVKATASPTLSATAVPTPTPAPAAFVKPEGEADEVAENTPSPTPIPTPAPTPSPTPDPVGCFSSLHAGRFTDGEGIRTENSYQSPNVSVTVETYTENGFVYHVADLYIRDISSFQTVFADDTFGKGYSERMEKADARTGSLLTLNGDFYGLRNYGVLFRNGTLYRTMNNAICDYCVLFWDGTMKVYAPGPVDIQALIDEGAYQSWYFGPMLLDENGNKMTEFNSNLGPRNPRSALGYYEPGHYCFVVVEGRSERSKGATLTQLSEIMYNLGCRLAYNLDGGETAQMMLGGKTVNELIDGGRSCSDFIIITEPVQ